MVGAATALVIGTPLTTFIGQAAGWRTAMLTVAAVSLALAVTARRLLPPLPGSSRDRRQPAPGIAATLRLPGLTIVLTVTLAVVTGHFALYTYMAPYAAEQLDVLGTAFTVVLLAYGTAAVAGSVLGGRLADLGPVTGTRAAATTFVAALLGLWLAGRAGAPVVGVPLMLLWGGTFSVLAVSTALAALRRAPGAHAETANAVYGIVFQIGILAGSALGATGVAAGLLAGVPLVAATCGLVMLALALHGGRAFRGDPPTGPGPHATPHPTR
jgi:predicted MFS family arabinose efflux permease